MNHSFSCETRIPYKPALFQYLQVVIKGRDLCHMLTIAIIDLLYFCNFNVCAKNDDRGNQKTFSMMARDVRIESLLFTHNINVSKKDSFVLAQYFVMISILHFSMINRVEGKSIRIITKKVFAT